MSPTPVPADRQPMLPPGELAECDASGAAVLRGFERLAAQMSGLPSSRLWLAEAGPAPGAEAAWCEAARHSATLLEVEDARSVLRGAASDVAHFVGMPLALPDGTAVGALCAWGPAPGRLAPAQRTQLEELAATASQVLALRQRGRALEHEKKMFDAARLSELVPVGMFSCDDEARILHGNAHWAAMLSDGPPEPLLGHGWRASIHPDDLEPLLGGFEAAVTARRTFAGVVRTRPNAEGAIRWLRFRVGPVSDDAVPGLGPATWIGASIDVTATLQLETELQDQNALLARALAASELGLWEADLVSQTVFLSSGWSRLTGVSAQERVVKKAATVDFFPPDEMMRLRASFRPLLKGHIERLSVEHRMRTPRGEIWVLTEATVSHRDEDGWALKVVGTCKNITARREAEAALQSALQAADAANRAKSEFLATMSHEIRTPLNGVIGLTQLLATAALPPMEADSVRMIDSCAKSLLSLVDNILDLSKIEAGRLTLDDVPTELPRMLGEVADVFSVRAAEKGLRFSLNVRPDVPGWVLGDPGRLRQILLNLLGNALKFTPEGRFSLAADTAVEAGRPVLRLAVSDSGIGISPADQARLFTRFTQVDGSATRQYAGTGLGLAISRQLAQLMGGDIRLASRPGAGSTFTVVLPLRATQPPAAVGAATAAQPVRSDARILLAEDNDVNRLVAGRLLASLGYEDVTAVVNGQEAVDACARADFDLVLMDCQMPVLDGIAATQALRASGFDAPILALTASATSSDRDRCLAAGMNDYLTKPIELAVLADKIARVLRGRGDTMPAALEPVAQPAVFDDSVLTSTFGGDTELFATSRELFLAQTRPALDQLEAAATAGDTARVRFLAHRVRGSALTLGAAELAEVCGALEQGAPVPARRVRQAMATFVRATEDMAMAEA